MTACTYYSGKTCPETSPTETRCLICILLIQQFRNEQIKHNVNTAKLPS